MAVRFTAQEVALVREYVSRHRAEGDSTRAIKARLRKAKVDPRLVVLALRNGKAPSSHWFLFWLIIVVLAVVVFIGAFLLASGR